MQTQRKPWPERDRAQPRPPRTYGFNVIVGEAVAVMAQMVPLHRMHRSEHQHAQDQQDNVGHSPPQPDRVVATAVVEPQAGQEKDKGKRQRERVETISGENQRSGKP